MSTIAFTSPRRGRGASSTTMTAAELHRHALEAHRVGNRGRLALAQALRIFKESGEYEKLGFSTLITYADKTFGFRKSETYAMVRVAVALDDLPRCLEAFSAGRICWTALRAITEVASSDTEEQWLEFAAGHTAERLWAETQDAKYRERNAPRKGGYGLPALTRKITLRLTASEHEKFRKVLKIYGKRAAEKLGREDVSLEEAVVYLSEQLLAAESEGRDGGDTRDPARYALIYQACPQCGRAGVHTAEGLVEVDREEIERVAGEADVEVVSGEKGHGSSAASAGDSGDGGGCGDGGDGGACGDGGGRGSTGAGAASHAGAGFTGSGEIDNPTSSSLRRRMLLRDGALCGNPHCPNAADHVHHIVYRSEGGATAAQNLVAVCSTCHALIHAGLLAVSGQPGELEWRSQGDGLTDDLTSGGLRREALAADALPVFRIESTAVENVGSSREQGEESTAAEMSDSTAVESEGEEADALSALRNLGMTRREAADRVRMAGERLRDGSHTLEEWIRTALAGCDRGGRRTPGNECDKRGP